MGALFKTCTTEEEFRSASSIDVIVKVGGCKPCTVYPVALIQLAAEKLGKPVNIMRITDDPYTFISNTGMAFCGNDGGIRDYAKRCIPVGYGIFVLSGFSMEEYVRDTPHINPIPRGMAGYVWQMLGPIISEEFEAINMYVNTTIFTLVDLSERDDSSMIGLETIVETFNTRWDGSEDDFANAVAFIKDCLKRIIGFREKVEAEKKLMRKDLDDSKKSYGNGLVVSTFVSEVGPSQSYNVLLNDEYSKLLINEVYVEPGSNDTMFAVYSPLSRIKVTEKLIHDIDRYHLCENIYDDMVVCKTFVNAYEVAQAILEAYHNGEIESDSKEEDSSENGKE